jgi:Domain of unknown function (DUF4293)
MIQRIQSIYLFLAAAAGFGQFGLPYLRADAASPVVAAVPVLADTVFNPLDNIGLTGLCALSGAVSLLAIFLFRNRALQARVTAGAVLACAMLAILLSFTLYQILNALPQGGGVQYRAGLILPTLALIFNWLAGRAIKKDEALVKSMDRLR